MSIVSHTLVRNGEDFVRQCLESVLPHVTRTLVLVDSRCTDATHEILDKIKQKNDNIFIEEVKIQNASYDLVQARNALIKASSEDWIWILDSDEYYPQETIQEVLSTIHDPYDTLALSSWSPWNREFYHVTTSRIPSGRVFKNSPNLEWRGGFGKEKLYKGGIQLWDKDSPRSEVKILENKYIHFTHMKKDTWRAEMHKERRADGRYLRPLPQLVVNEMNKIYE